MFRGGGGIPGPADVEDDHRIETKGVFGQAKDYSNYLGTVLTMSRTTQFEMQELNELSERDTFAEELLQGR